MNYSYRVGLPLWRQMARAGIPLSIRIDVHQDPESGSYWANSSDLDGLVVSGTTLDEVRNEAELAAVMLLNLQLTEQPRNVTASLHMKSPLCIA